MNELGGEKEYWDIKKIIMLILIAGIFAFGFKTFVLDKNSKTSQVEGVSITKNPIPSILPKDEIQRNVEGKLNDLKNEVNNINVIEIATSTPAVQKVLNDFKNLQNLPQSQAKDACLKICSSL